MADVKENELSKITQSSGVTSATTIRMVDANGESVQIERNVFMQAIRDVLPSVFSDQGTGIANVPVLNSSGVLGKSSAANTAKVMAETIERRTRLTDFDLATLRQAIADQNLEKYGLKVGDQKTIGGRTYVIAGLNVMKGSSTPYRVSENHVGLIVLPHTTQAWNESGNTYTGADGRGAGYKNSDLHYYLKNTLLPLVEGDLGASSLIAHNKLLSNAVNTTGYNRYGSASGCASSWDWESDCKICALSEVQVYGSAIWSSSGFDTGEACRQLDVFRKYNHTEIFGGEYPWLRDVVSSSYAASAGGYGTAYCNPASDALYVAALILFK